MSCEVCVSLIVFIDIEIITIDVVATTSIVAAIAAISTVSSVSRAVINVEDLLAHNTLRVTLVAVRALADASIVQKY